MRRRSRPRSKWGDALRPGMALGSGEPTSAMDRGRLPAVDPRQSLGSAPRRDSDPDALRCRGMTRTIRGLPAANSETRSRRGRSGRPWPTPAGPTLEPDRPVQSPDLGRFDRSCAWGESDETDSVQGRSLGREYPVEPGVPTVPNGLFDRRGSRSRARAAARPGRQGDAVYAGCSTLIDGTSPSEGPIKPKNELGGTSVTGCRPTDSRPKAESHERGSSRG